MTSNSRIYDADIMAKIATFYSGLTALIDEFQGSEIIDKNHPLYVFSMEIVLRHVDGYTIGRIGMEDFPFFEITEETYGESSS